MDRNVRFPLQQQQIQEEDDDLNNRADLTDPRFHWRTGSRTKNPEDKSRAPSPAVNQGFESNPVEKEFQYKCRLLMKDMK